MFVWSSCSSCACSVAPRFSLCWVSLVNVFSLGCHNNIVDWMSSQKFIFLQFWSLGVRDQGPSMVGFWWEGSSWCVDGCLLPVCSQGREKGEWELCGVSSNKRANLTVRARYLSKAPSPNAVTLGVRASAWVQYKLWGGTQVIYSREVDDSSVEVPIRLPMLLLCLSRFPQFLCSSVCRVRSWGLGVAWHLW